MSSLSRLSDPSLVIIFATSPAGLGHLRVTEALSHGLPKTAFPLMLGTKAPITKMLYRFISIHPATRRMMEVLQAKEHQDTVAYLGKKLLSLQANDIYKQLKTILNERLVVPKTVLLVASHPGLAHQMGQFKQKLAKEFGVKILLVEQVTDDSPQSLWYVNDADLICVPSEYTRDALLAYAKKYRLPEVTFAVIAYPISPLLAKELPESIFAKRFAQTDPLRKEDIHISVPISGAAVGTSFVSNYVQTMHKLSNRYIFHVITRDAPFTQLFIRNMVRLSYVRLHVSNHDRETVALYDRVFEESPISLEITKPSEQAFKALATPQQQGGALLLFSNPVGRQEYDNLHFLRNHGLMPHGADTRLLWQLAREGKSLHGTELTVKAHHWRCILLPEDPKEAAQFTQWCLEERLFATMMNYTRTKQTPEVQSNGVEQFWNQVVKLLEE
jgi:hypothetical protein